MIQMYESHGFVCICSCFTHSTVCRLQRVIPVFPFRTSMSWTFVILSLPTTIKWIAINFGGHHILPHWESTYLPQGLAVPIFWSLYFFFFRTSVHYITPLHDFVHNYQDYWRKREADLLIFAFS